MARLDLELNPDGVRRGARVAKQELDGVARSADRVENELDQAARAGTRMGGAVRQMGGSFGGARGQIQNTAFQIGDFATQVGAGTAASVALGQQLPQLLGGFGALGAVLGAVVAIGVPLAAAFIDLGGAAKVAEEDVNDLSEAVERAGDAAERAGVKIAAVSSSLSSIGGPVELVRGMRELEDITAQFVESTQASFLALGTGGLIGGSINAVEKLSEMYEISTESADQLLTAMARLEGAQGPQEISSEIDALVRGLIESEGGFNSLSGAALEFVAQLVQIQGDADTLQEIFEQYGPVLDGATGGLESGLARSLELARKLDAVQAQLNASSFVGGGRGGDPRDFVGGVGTRLSAADLIAADRQQEAASTRTARGGGGGGGGRSAADEAEKTAQAYERLRSQLDPAFAAQQQFLDAQQALNEALAAGQISQDEYNETLELARDKFEDATDGLQKYRAEMERLDDLQSFDTFVSGAAKGLQQSLSDFLFNPFEDGVRGMVLQFADALRRMAADAIAAQITQAIFGAIGGFGGGIGLRDTGGYLPAGSTAIVAEKRPEYVNGQLVASPAMVRGPAQITSGSATQSMGGGSQPVNIQNNLLLNVQELVEAIAKNPRFEQRVSEINMQNGFA